MAGPERESRTPVWEGLESEIRLGSVQPEAGEFPVTPVTMHRRPYLSKLFNMSSGKQAYTLLAYHTLVGKQ